jgi:hypothetical protein
MADDNVEGAVAGSRVHFQIFHYWEFKKKKKKKKKSRKSGKNRG